MEQDKNNIIGTASYSPEDNKIRVRAFSRLAPELYARVRAAGFIWAPKQELFVAPMWTPEREDLAEELCGELGDEDTSLVDRAEERAERFEGYSDKREADADRAREGVAAIADNIPLGQPILVGHHSEKRARKDAERIENGMRKAVKMWETSKYWTQRAKGALRHAKYKELPDVRARRIKKLQAEKRGRERALDAAVEADVFWNRPDLTKDEAIRFAGGASCGFTMGRKEGDRKDFNQQPSAYEALTRGFPTLYAPRTFEEVVEVGQRVHKAGILRNTRWILHYENRLAYEIAMLNEQGAGDLIAPRKRPTQLPLLNYRQAIIAAPRWGREVQNFPQVEMTSEDYKRIYEDQRGTLTVDGTHRVRFAFVELRDGKPARFADHSKGVWSACFFTDSKIHKKPTKEAPPEVTQQATPEDTPEDFGENVLEWAKFEKEHEALLDSLAYKSLRRTYSELTRKEKLGIYGNARMQLSIEDERAKQKRILDFADRCVEADKIRAAAGASSINVDTHEMQFEAAGEVVPELSKDEQFQALKQTLRAGVKVVSAPQLFPTPPDLARRMVKLANIGRDDRTLEPSFGTGALINAIRNELPGVPGEGPHVVCVEINNALADRMRDKEQEVICGDFLQLNGTIGTFDRVVMNPPFKNGADILHIRHALNKLNPGGRLVACCAAGPRQYAALQPLADLWEELPDGTFAEQGTNVRTVLLVIDKPV